MQLVLISDTHGSSVVSPRFEGADCIIHAGDCTLNGSMQELKEFIQWYSILPGATKILVAGNHDHVFVHNPEEAKARLEEAGIIYLQDSGCSVNGYNVWGSPWTLPFGLWDFMIPESDLAERWRQIPDHTDILVTHGPCWGVGDSVSHRFKLEATGSRSLRQRVYEVKPKMHVFGHIHENHGAVTLEGTTYINASICNDRLSPVYSPIIYILD